MAYRYKKRKYKLKPMAIIVLFIAIALLIGLVLYMANKAKDKETATISSSLPSAQISSQETDTSSEESMPDNSSNSSNETSSLPASSTPPQNTDGNDPYVATVGGKGAWNLMLLNRTNSISMDMEMSKTKFDTQWIDSRIAPAFQAIVDAAKKEGITLYLRSGYRSISTQRTNYQNAVNSYISKGYTEEQAILKTEKYYARPGESEHHTGLALDIITPEYHNEIKSLDERFAQTKAYQWLIEHCADYGFILRYPADKVDITKINYEPWHYRYVGVSHAKYMKQNNLSLEEYLQ